MVIVVKMLFYILISPDCLPCPVSRWKPGLGLLLVVPPGFLQPVEERRPVVVTCRLDFTKKAKLGAEKILLNIGL